MGEGTVQPVMTAAVPFSVIGLCAYFFFTVFLCCKWYNVVRHYIARMRI